MSTAQFAYDRRPTHARIRPWVGSLYDGLTVELAKRMTHHFQASVSYTFAKEWDEALHSNRNFNSQINSGTACIVVPTDSYAGAVSQYTDPATGESNTSQRYIASNGNGSRRSSRIRMGRGSITGRQISIPDTFSAQMIWELPLGFQLSGIFRAQSGFPYMVLSNDPQDIDGDGLYSACDLNYISNSTRVPKFVNMDTHVSKAFKFGDSRRLSFYFELFNLFATSFPPV